MPYARNALDIPHYCFPGYPMFDTVSHHVVLGASDVPSGAQTLTRISRCGPAARRMYLAPNLTLTLNLALTLTLTLAQAPILATTPCQVGPLWACR